MQVLNTTKSTVHTKRKSVHVMHGAQCARQLLTINRGSSYTIYDQIIICYVLYNS